MTFVGDKKKTTEAVRSAAFDALKDAFADSNINWDSKSCERALKEFGELSLLVSEKVLSNMEDAGDGVPYTQGHPTRQDVKLGVELVKEYYNRQTKNSKYGEKKADSFKKVFESRLAGFVKIWKEQAKSFFKRSKS